LDSGCKKYRSSDRVAVAFGKNCTRTDVLKAVKIGQQKFNVFGGLSALKGWLNVRTASNQLRKKLLVFSFYIGNPFGCEGGFGRGEGIGSLADKRSPFLADLQTTAVNHKHPSRLVVIRDGITKSAGSGQHPCHCDQRGWQLRLD